jgi:hypothetical protein
MLDLWKHIRKALGRSRRTRPCDKKELSIAVLGDSRESQRPSIQPNLGVLGIRSNKLFDFLSRPGYCRIEFGHAKMTAISRGTGLTESERYLAKLADQTFLRLWSYPNTFFDKKQHGAGIGKELADLLVVCGDDVMIFSDKAIKWPDAAEMDLSWSRWYRAAIEKSVAQIRGAERWLTLYPKRIFLDPACSQPFPIDMPSPDTGFIHGIIVATGATEAVRAFCNDDSGTFIVNGLLKGEAHTTPGSQGYMPFSFGDVDPAGSFIHVFDPTALDIVMNELDTISDFAEYLKKRAAFIRSGRFHFATGEEDLLAFYLQNGGDDGAHLFVLPDLHPSLAEHVIQIASGEYKAFRQKPQYKGRRDANRASYNWDKLIDVFVDSILAGTSVALLDQQPDAALAERALRLMALENRVYRRILGNAIIDTLAKAKDQRADRYVRRILPGKNASNRRIAYIFLVLNFRSNLSDNSEYATYRKIRSRMLEMYCLDLLDQVANVDIVVGIGVDSAPEVSGRAGGSEDLLAIDRPVWTDELRDHLAKARILLNITPLAVSKTISVSTNEYPRPQEVHMSRQERRAKERARRKAARSKQR